VIASICHSAIIASSESEPAYRIYQPDVCIPVVSPTYQVHLFFDPLILKAGSSNLHYAVEAFPLPAPSPNWQIYDIHPGYHFGFNLGIKGYFHSLDTAIISNWQHFNGSDCSKHVAGSNNMIGPFFEIGPDAIPYTQSEGTVKFDFDEFNIDYGQLFKCGQRFGGTAFCSVSYVHISQTMCSLYSNEDASITRTIITPTCWTGAGLRVGLDFMYDIYKGLALAGKTTASLLNGSLRNQTTYLAVSPALEDLGITPPNVQHTRECSRSQIVPALGQKLGLAYTYQWCDRYALILEAGYLIQVYFQALQTNDISSEVITPPVTPDTVGVFARTFHRTTSNFSLSGAYISIGVGF
jgi:hypothetical protein